MTNEAKALLEQINEKESHLQGGGLDWHHSARTHKLILLQSGADGLQKFLDGCIRISRVTACKLFRSSPGCCK